MPAVSSTVTFSIFLMKSNPLFPNSAANFWRTSRTSSTVVSRLEISLCFACSWVRRGIRMIVPSKGCAGFSITDWKAAMWFWIARSPASSTKSYKGPPGDHSSWGSKISKRSSETIAGESVQLYTCKISKVMITRRCKPTELNPRPNLPVVKPSSSFRESPRRERFLKSFWVNMALLYASKAGPWYFASFGWMSSLVGWALSSRWNR